VTPQYLDTARLLVRIGPAIFYDDTFALKGGTAINLFVRDMPRLSVDLDLAYRNYQLDRDAAIAHITASLQESATRLRLLGYTVQIPTTNAGHETKLLIRQGSIQVKVEANYVLRGTVAPIQHLDLQPRASESLTADLRLPIVSEEDLYGGKLVAAMDRQHPRDLFDVMELLENEGITPAIRQAFVVYLASHDRPVHEVLFPAPKDLSHEFTHGFLGMTVREVTREELESARMRMIDTLHSQLSADERAFLLSLVQNTPQWHLLNVPHLQELPALKWKLQNLAALQRTNPQKFAEQYDVLFERFK
jgi:predicted nucleotidyltransferase component of viral defense system